MVSRAKIHSSGVFCGKVVLFLARSYFLVFSEFLEACSS